MVAIAGLYLVVSQTKYHYYLPKPIVCLFSIEIGTHFINSFQWFTTTSDGRAFKLYGQVDTGYHTLAGDGALELMHDQDSVCESNYTEFTGHSIGTLF